MKQDLARTEYRHWQWGTLIIGVIGIPGLVLLVAALASALRALPLIIGAALIVTAFLFHGLAVEIDDREIRISLGPGWIRKRIRLERIKTLRRVRNPISFGWGIHYIGTGWLWNVSGRDAIELELEDGKVFRIGTDDPEGLAAAVAKRSSPSPSK